MKITELIKSLKNYLELKGDLEVGFDNCEYGGSASVKAVAYKKAHRCSYPYGCLDDDDKVLGNEFINIGYYVEKERRQK